MRSSNIGGDFHDDADQFDVHAEVVFVNDSEREVEVEVQAEQVEQVETKAEQLVKVEANAEQIEQVEAKAEQVEQVEAKAEQVEQVEAQTKVETKVNVDPYYVWQFPSPEPPLPPSREQGKQRLRPIPPPPECHLKRQKFS